MKKTAKTAPERARKTGEKAFPDKKPREFETIAAFTAYVYKCYEWRARDSAEEWVRKQTSSLPTEDAQARDGEPCPCPPGFIFLRHRAPDIAGRERVEIIISAMKSGFEKELSRKRALRKSFDLMHQILSYYAVDPWAWVDFLNGSRLYNNVVTDEEVSYCDRTRLRDLWAEFRDGFINTDEGRELRQELTGIVRDREASP